MANSLPLEGLLRNQPPVKGRTSTTTLEIGEFAFPLTRKPGKRYWQFDDSRIAVLFNLDIATRHSTLKKAEAYARQLMRAEVKRIERSLSIPSLQPIIIDED